MEEQIRQIEALLRLFRIERYAYLIAVLLCALILMGLAVFSLLNERIDFKYFVGLLTPSGAMIFLINNILKFWNDAIELLRNQPDENI
ncbi:hypothetical protein [Runella limosa]|uniref:hypothetical protein n=1 Tax=Runella limosa TaxID=370978 RepID=UPI00048CFD81|nr:hypothetical protein [Runella limosa]